MKSLSPRVRILLLIVVPALAYAASLGGDFLYDDVDLVEKNRFVRDLSSLPEIFTTSFRAGATSAEDSLYRPVTIASFAFNAAFGGGVNPGPFHAVNIALHIAVVLLLYSVLSRLFEARLAFLASLLYSVHPAISEAVINISGRSELLGAMFGLLAWRVLLGDEELRRPARTLPLAAAAALLSGLSKESAVALPGLVLLGDLWRRTEPGASLISSVRSLDRAAMLRFGSLCGVMVIVLGMRMAVLGHLGLPASEIPFTDNPAATAPALDRVTTALSVIGRYVVLSIVPLRLSGDYSYSQIPVLGPPGDVFAILGGLWLAAALVLPFVARARAAAFALGVFWGGLFIASNLLVPVGTIMAERLLYVPMVGVALLAAFAIGAIRNERAVLAVLAIVVVAFAGRTAVRCGDWKDREAFWEANVQSAPRSVKSRFNRGNSAYEEGQRMMQASNREKGVAYLEDALADYEIATTTYPDFAKAWVNKGNALLMLERYDEAEPALRRAAEILPEEATPYVNLSELYLTTGRVDEAVKALEDAAARIGDHPKAGEVYWRLARTRSGAGDGKGSLEALDEALRLAPNDPAILIDGVRAHAMSGNRDRARELVRRALRVSPRDPDVRRFAEQLGVSP